MDERYYVFLYRNGDRKNTVTYTKFAKSICEAISYAQYDESQLGYNSVAYEAGLKQ